jgi:peptidoglycan/LPS O-acetylase OafA/YrhL
VTKLSTGQALMMETAVKTTTPAKFLGAPPKATLTSLTSIRFFLALWVVIYHYSGHAEWTQKLPEGAYYLLNSGFEAVSFFFVLSGFVLAYNYNLAEQWSKQRIKGFAVARFSRIYPAYFLGLLLVAPFLIRDLQTTRAFATPGKLGVDGLLSILMAQSWFPASAESWNHPAWSLSVEAFFYVCFPVIGVAVWKSSRTLGRAAAMGVILWGSAVTLPLVALSFPHLFPPGTMSSSIAPAGKTLWLIALKYYPLLHLPTFCVGILLARFYSYFIGTQNPICGRGYLLYIPGMLIEVGVLAYGHHIPFPAVHNGLLLPFHGLVILGLALGGGAPVRWLSAPLLVFLGNASYATYILQIPIGLWTHSIWKRLFHEPQPGFTTTSVYVVCVVLGSALVYSLFEEPAHRYVKSKLVSMIGKSPEVATTLSSKQCSPA